MFIKNEGTIVHVLNMRKHLTHWITKSYCSCYLELELEEIFIRRFENFHWTISQ